MKRTRGAHPFRSASAAEAAFVALLLTAIAVLGLPATSTSAASIRDTSTGQICVVPACPYHGASKTISFGCGSLEGTSRCHRDDPVGVTREVHPLELT